MKFAQLLSLVGQEPVFESSALLAGNVDPAYIRRQLSEWARTGKLVSLRRGLYCLAEPYRKVQPHSFLTANRIRQASYVSRESALAHYDLIPEHVPVVTSVTTGRPKVYETPLGVFDYRHIQQEFFNAYRSEVFADGQRALVAGPEKALLDLIYLTPDADTPEYLIELRLKNLDILDWSVFWTIARNLHSAKLLRATKLLESMARENEEQYEAL